MDVISPDAATWTPRPEWRLPRQTGDLHADWRAVYRAHAASTEPWQERACLLRIQQLAERQHARTAAVLAPWRTLIEDVSRAFTQIGQQLALAYPGLARASEPKVTQRDVVLHRPGHAGPSALRRPPRTIGRPSTGPRR